MKNMLMKLNELNNKLSEKDLAASKITNEINKGKESGVDKE